MNGPVVAAILRKDLAVFGRDRFFVLMAAMSIVLYPLVFWLMPADVDETLRLAVAPESAAELLGAAAEGAAEGGGEEQEVGLAVVGFPDATALADAVAAGTDGVAAGLVVPAGFPADGGAVTLVVGAAAPPELVGTMRVLVAEIAYAAAGEAPPVDPASEVVVLGEDRAGDQVSVREQMRPLLAFLVLLTETLALASLVAAEVQQRTVTAVLVTPATTADFLAAKGLLGTAMAFVQAALILGLVGGLATGAPILLLTLLLGAALVTGFGMIAGAFGRDFMSVLFVSVAFMVPLMIPAFAALFPGGASGWVRALPTYPLVETIVAVTTRGAGWTDVAPLLAALAAWCVVSFAVGVLVLRRKVARL